MQLPAMLLDLVRVLAAGDMQLRRVAMTTFQELRTCPPRSHPWEEAADHAPPPRWFGLFQRAGRRPRAHPTSVPACRSVARLYGNTTQQPWAKRDAGLRPGDTYVAATVLPCAHRPAVNAAAPQSLIWELVMPQTPYSKPLSSPRKEDSGSSKRSAAASRRFLLFGVGPLEGPAAGSPSRLAGGVIEADSSAGVASPFCSLRPSLPFAALHFFCNPPASAL
jgi:hypothetical protein